MRLIKADQVKAFECYSCDGYCEVVGEKAAKCLSCEADCRCDYIKYIDTIPKVDAVEVVRCKDCIHAIPSGVNKEYRSCDLNGEADIPEHYCSHGERIADADS